MGFHFMAICMVVVVVVTAVVVVVVTAAAAAPHPHLHPLHQVVAVGVILPKALPHRVAT